MSAFSLKCIRKGSSANALIYDTRYGTAVDANGWITFGLHSGCRRIWIDSVNGNDSNNGLTAATAKATWNAGWNLWSGNGNGVSGGTGTLPGDQLMIAGGQSQTYTDSITGNLSNCPGLSATYPMAITNYNSTAPSDVSQYGRLVGANMPIVTVTDQSGTGGGSLSMTAFTNGNLAIQGVEFKATNALSYSSLGYTYSSGNHAGIIYQNCRFNGVGVGINPATGTNTAAANAQGGHISKCSMWSSSGLFVESYDQFYIQDFITIHNGWNIGASRDDTVPNGGAQSFTHNFYYHATNTNGRFDRVVSADGPGEAFGIRGDTAGASQLVAIDAPFGLAPGGFSGTYLEAPNGINIKFTDVVIAGSNKIDATHPGGVGSTWNNSLTGSFIRNVAIFDFEDFDTADPTYNRYVVPTRDNVNQPVAYILLDKWSGWRWAKTEISSTYPSVPIGSGSGDLVNIHQSWSNSILDVNPTGLNGTVTNCSARVSAPAGYKTRVQTWTAMGFSSKAAMFNAMLFRPDLPWARAIMAISLPAMGLTPTYSTASPPDMTGITPPVIYPVALGTLTLGTLSFAHASSSSTLVGGCSGDFTLASSDLPAGFTLVGRLLSYDGTHAAGTPTFHITETSRDTLGTNTTAFTLAIS